MHESHIFLQALTIVLGVAAVTTVLFQRLGQPVVLGYILAGVIVGPHFPVPLVADRAVVHTLSELGVILLMFSLGLEFRLVTLFRVGPTAGITAIFQSSIMIQLGYLTGRAFGWSPMESLFAGSLIAISSTTIIARAFDEQRIHGKLRQLVVGILLIEDLIAILLMAILIALASGEDFSARTIATSSGRLATFMLVLLAAGMAVIPRTIRAIDRLGRPENLLIASIGICFSIALLTDAFGYSVALGAFLAGSLIAESGIGARIAHQIEPVRDVFAAVFFVSVGMLFDPVTVVEHASAVAVLTGVVLVGKIVSVAVGAFLTGNGTRTSLQAGMSLAQIGEFSFIIAGLGLSLKATGEFLYPVAVAVSAITTLTTPWLIRASGPAADLLDRRLPRPLQTFTALYASWMEKLRNAPRRQTDGATARRIVRRLLLDAALVATVLIGFGVSIDRLSAWLVSHLDLAPALARIAVVGAAFLVASPFAVGIFRLARALGLALARAVLPDVEEGGLDLADAPRRMLVVTLQLAVVLLVGMPLLALTQPFLPGPAASLIFAASLVLVGVAFWRSAANLHGHVRAGAEVLVEVLAAQARAGARGGEDSLEKARSILPGLGEPVALLLTRGCPAIGQSIGDLSIRGRTGAIVLAITRGKENVLLPGGSAVLLEGDVLALAGSADAVTEARRLLTGRLN